jgi:hypothetical protein
MKKVQQPGVFIALLLYSTSVFAIETSSEPMQPQVTLGAFDSNVYGVIAHSEYANFISSRDVGIFLLDYGPNQFRAGLAWGRILTPKQRIKLSVEHFSQYNTFDFAAYPDGMFVGQNQFGGQYELALSHKRLEAAILRGYYFQANDASLAEVPTIINEKNQRTVVGGVGGGFSIGPRWQLWPGAQIEMGFGYDVVHFSTQNEPAKDSSGFGQGAILTQQFSPSAFFELAVANRKPYQQYSASLNLPIHRWRNRLIGLKLQASHLHSHVLPAGNENIMGLSLIYRWDGDSTTTQRCFQGDSNCDLINWTSRSAAYLPGVFVQRDQKVID